MRHQHCVGGNKSQFIGNFLICTFCVPEGLKLSPAMYCPFLKESPDSRFDKLPLATLKKITLLHDNAKYCHIQKRQQRNFFNHLDM